MNYEITRLIRSLCFRVWIWAVLLNTLLFTVFFAREAGTLLLPGIVLVFMTSFFLSLPAFAALLLLLPVLAHNNLPYRSIGYIMLAACCLLGLGVFLVFAMMMGGSLHHEEWRLALLPALAGAGAMALQYKRLQEICRERDFIREELRSLGETVQ